MKPGEGGREMDDSKLTVRAVERALDILLVFTQTREMGLTEISGRVKLHKSTVHRLLASLESKGFVIRDPATEKYRLGFRIWELSANLSQTDDLGVLLLPEMEQLRDLLGETITLYIRYGKERVRIQEVQSSQAIRRVAPVGARLPLYAGASSKVLLAFAEVDVIQQIIQAEDWPSTINKEQFMLQLKEIKDCGYATSVGERELGVAAVAAPIYNRTGKLIAALSVSGPANRLTQEKMKEHAPVIMQTAVRMGRMIR